MLLNMDQQCVEDARRILTFLCCSVRPLTVLELIEGIAVELGRTPKLDPGARLPEETRFVEYAPASLNGKFKQMEKPLSVSHITQ
jgi:hypothetical protein